MPTQIQSNVVSSFTNTKIHTIADSLNEPCLQDLKQKDEQSSQHNPNHKRQCYISTT